MTAVRTPSPAGGPAASRVWGIGARFGGVVAVLLVAVAAVGAAGVGGLVALHVRAQDLYEDEVVNLSRVHDLMDSLDDAYGVALALIPTNDPERRRRLETELEHDLAPSIERQIAGLREAGERVAGLWRSFYRFARSPEFLAAGTDARTAALNDDLADRTSELYQPLHDRMEAITEQLVDEGEQEAAEARRYYRLARNTILAVAAAAVAAGLGLVRRLTHAVVSRTREYAAFAAAVAAGAATGRLQPRGEDELTDLGHALNRMVDEQDRFRAEHERRAAFTAALQGVSDESEAYLLVRRHLERAVPGATVVVFARNNSNDRLEPRTPLPAGAGLEERLEGAIPRSCRALRTARPHREDAAGEALVDCAVCAGTAGASTCLPLVVGGEVMGSVLASTERPLDAEGQRVLHDAVTQAAPVLANLRNLAVAEHRAAVDPLTGLSTRGALQELLARLVAQAGRQATPLAALLIDLDHFKVVNDTYGHDVGDAVLAAVGAAVRDTIRAGDVAGRYGGGGVPRAPPRHRARGRPGGGGEDPPQPAPRPPRRRPTRTDGQPRGGRPPRRRRRRRRAGPDGRSGPLRRQARGPRPGGERRH